MWWRETTARDLDGQPGRGWCGEPHAERREHRRLYVRGFAPGRRMVGKARWSFRVRWGRSRGAVVNDRSSREAPKRDMTTWPHALRGPDQPCRRNGGCDPGGGDGVRPPAVFVINTEGATDPDRYRELTGLTAPRPSLFRRRRSGLDGADMTLDDQVGFPRRRP